MTTEVLERPAPVCELRQPRSTVTLLLFAATSFLSAFLLFQVQLIVNKHILPWFGGSAAVWTTSMLVFQLLLLGGYVYAHLVTTRLTLSAQFMLHTAILSAAVALIVSLSLLWPSAITPGPTWKSAHDNHPVTSVCLIILVSTGLPFFVLSTSAPLLQSWFGRLGFKDKTYRLYALSNVGSLLGLFSFPFIVEPALGSKMQGRLWAVLFCLFAVACLLCGRKARDCGEAYQPASTQGGFADALPVWHRRVNYVLWFSLAACASSLLLSTTNLLCQEVITVPLLWVLPLCLYLFSFILCFDHPRWYQRAVFHPLLFIALFLTCAALQSHQSFLARLLSPLLLLFATCMICHGELVRLKPEVAHLTSFYLTVAAGGAAGGLFVALLAPRLFTSSLEFQVTLGLGVVLLLATLFLDRQSWVYSRGFLIPLVGIAGTIALAYSLGLFFPDVAKLIDSIRFYPALLLIGTVVVLGALVFERSSPPQSTWFRFTQIFVAAIAMGSLVALYYSAQPRTHQLLSKRNFYGVIQVFRDGNLKELVVGETAHGGQLDTPNQRFPILYYGPDSGIGVVLRNHPKRASWGSNLKIGVVGLGVGTLAAYGRPGDSIRFYEIDPNVVDLTTGEQPAFTYLRDSPAAVSTVLGDARLSLEREAAEGNTDQFDVLALDAFSGDAIPVHLLTEQAFETYWRQLASDKGIIAVHITSRHVDLVPVLIGAAQHFQASWVMTYNRGEGLIFPSGWFLMSKSREALNIPGLQPITVQYNRNLAPRLWTDDRSDVFRLLY